MGYALGVTGKRTSTNRSARSLSAERLAALAERFPEFTPVGLHGGDASEGPTGRGVAVETGGGRGDPGGGGDIGSASGSASGGGSGDVSEGGAGGVGHSGGGGGGGGLPGLAVAIERTAVRRWMTLEYLLDRHLRRPMGELEPRMRGVLLAGAAQLVFMPSQPVHAVVDEMVEIAKRLVRPGAGAMVNAVLRRVANDVVPGGSGAGAAGVAGVAGVAASNRRGPSERSIRRVIPDRPVDVLLSSDILPDPRVDPALHLAIATSHPRALVDRWLMLYGPGRTAGLCRHSNRTPPVIVALGYERSEGGAAGGASEGLRAAEPSARPWVGGSGSASGGDGGEPATPHERAGYVVWRGGHEGLVKFLGERGGRRVQDPTSSRPVEAAVERLRATGVRPRRVLDLCAGRGTKTVQLAWLLPESRIVATDPDADRFRSLAATFGGFAGRAGLSGTPGYPGLPGVSGVSGLPGVEVVAFDRLEERVRSAARFDLVLLDVPCTNSGVLARRPEARYRFGAKSLNSLVALQRAILERGTGLLASGGSVLYATCSIEPAEGMEQSRWWVERHGGSVLAEELTLPSGAEGSEEDRSYHDGGYWALLGGR